MKFKDIDPKTLFLDDDGEEYRQLIIDGIETNYLVSESGKIFNFATNYYIHPTLDGSGRYVTGISVNGKVYRFYVHRLVYLVFCGPLIPGMTIDHLDENRTNNHWKNLEQVTATENLDRYNANHSKERYQKIYPDNVIEAVCKELAAGRFYKDIAAAMRISVRVMHDIVCGRTYRHISGKYLPFPDSARYHSAKRQVPETYLESLILQNYSDTDIAQLIGLDLSIEKNQLFLKNERKRVAHIFRNYHSPELLAKVENLITSGKSNKEIYAMTGLPYNKPNSWMIARLRQKLQIMDFNPEGVPLDIQEKIKEDIRSGMTNSQLEAKYGLDRTEYIIHMEARLRQAVKKENKRLANNQ